VRRRRSERFGIDSDVRSLSCKHAEASIRLTTIPFREVTMLSAMVPLMLMLTSADVASADPSPIDEILTKVAQEHAQQPAPVCSDERFLRRVTLDLTGRIPTVSERTAFLARPDRAALIDALLNGDEFPRMWAGLWTTQWYGYLDSDDSDRDALAFWLEEQLRDRRPYDEIVQAMIAATGESVHNGPVNFLLRHADDPVVKVSRSFLGVRLDCARCHDHPFDRWTQDDFTRMSRFFDGLERSTISQGNGRLTDQVIKVAAEERPRFLTGAQPRTSQWRQEFSWFLVKSRPFARNFANRVWYHLMGRGVIHPVDDVSRENPPAIPELLERLTDEALASKFDLRQMLRFICLSEAYQRESRSSPGDEARQRLFLVRSIKPLLPEQWHTAMCQALGRPIDPQEQRDFVEQFLGDALDADFSTSWEYRETIPGMMSRLVEQVTPPERNISGLFPRLLGREATPEELTRWSSLSPRDVCYLLLHSNEFAFNH
jgi:hypothetical protein